MSEEPRSTEEVFVSMLIAVTLLAGVGIVATLYALLRALEYLGVLDRFFP